MTREEKSIKKQKELKKIANKEKTKNIGLIIFKTLLIIVSCCIMLIAYSAFIGTKRLIIKETNINSKLIPTNFHGFKIIHFTDLYYGNNINDKQMQELVKEINKRHPDLVVFTGDLIDQKKSLTKDQEKKLITYLTSIDSNIGKYAIMGDMDNEEIFTNIMTTSNFTILNNQAELLYNEGYDAVLLVGLNSNIAGKQDIDSGFAYFNDPNNNPDIFTITLLHEPDCLDYVLSKYKTDLALAGHSLNGQIRLPYIGAVQRKKGAKKYYDSFYEIRNTKLFISSGIGTWNIPFRFLDRPSINFFRLIKQ